MDVEKELFDVDISSDELIRNAKGDCMRSIRCNSDRA